MPYKYLIGFTRGKKTKYLKSRETNFRRACQTLRNLLKGNRVYNSGEVARVFIDKDGEDYALETLYRKTLKRD